MLDVKRVGVALYTFLPDFVDDLHLAQDSGAVVYRANPVYPPLVPGEGV